MVRASPSQSTPVANALLVAAALAVSVVCTELGLRVDRAFHPLRYVGLEPPRPRDNEFRFYQYDSLLGWKNRAGAQGWFTLPDSRTYVLINSKGLRDVERSYRPQGKPRVLMLGDSFAWGFGVERRERFTDVVSMMVGRAVEIVNTGVAGYGTDQELLYYESEGYKYGARLVVLAFTLNDVVNNRHPVQYTYPKPRFVLRGDRLALQNVPVPARTAPWVQRYSLDQALPPRATVVSSTKRFLRNHLLSYAFLVDRSKSLLGSDLPHSESADPSDPLTQALILELRRQVEQRGARLVVAMVPDKLLVAKGTGLDTWTSYVRFFQAKGLDYVDLRPGFVEESHRGTALFLAADPHWNVAGHRLAAAVICRHLLEDTLVAAGASAAVACAATDRVTERRSAPTATMRARDASAPRSDSVPPGRH